MDLISKELVDNKLKLLAYYRSRGDELISVSKQTYSDTEFKKRASFVNKGLIEAKKNLIKKLEQISKKENWDKKLILETILLLTYTNYVVMLEARNEVWEYEYMTFARRIGELWEPFCLLCWDAPANDDVEYIIPPLFSDVKAKLTSEIDDFIEKLNISIEEKKELKIFYNKVWGLVTSGEVSLELDLHFENTKNKYVIDFKSGFSSNEKGNTNRLLLVASIYKILGEGHRCVLFVRAIEESNNHYLQTLKNSELWDVYCEKDTYSKIKEFTGFDLGFWMKNNIDWESDFSEETYTFLKDNNLTDYLKW